MQQRRLDKALRGLGMFTGVAYLIVGVAGAIWPGHWDDAAASDQIVWAVVSLQAGYWCWRDSDCCAVRLLAVRRSSQ